MERASRRKYLDRPLPRLLGGPTVAYDWEHWLVNRTLQLLANRGYAVVRVEFSGVEGFGKRIREAGAKQWSRKMTDDLIDALDWAIKPRQKLTAAPNFLLPLQNAPVIAKNPYDSYLI